MGDENSSAALALTLCVARETAENRLEITSTSLLLVSTSWSMARGLVPDDDIFVFELTVCSM